MVYDLFLFWKNGNILVFATGWLQFLVLIFYLFWSTERERCICVTATHVTYQHVNTGRHFSNNSVLYFVFVIKLVLNLLFVTVLVPFCRRLTGWWFCCCSFHHDARYHYLADGGRLRQRCIEMRWDRSQSIRSCACRRTVLRLYAIRVHTFHLERNGLNFEIVSVGTHDE